MNDFDTFKKMPPNNVDNLGKIIVATGFEWLPKVQKIAQSGHTGCEPNIFANSDFQNPCTFAWLLLNLCRCRSEPCRRSLCLEDR